MSEIFNCFYEGNKTLWSFFLKDVGFNYECIPILHTNTLALIHTLEHFAS